MNSSEHSPKVSANPRLPAIKLSIKGNVIPFKNRKRSGIRHGKPMTYTEPRVKAHMREITASFESQLAATIQDAETVTGCSRQSLIASFLPEDDSLAWIPEIIITSQKVATGNERTEITIEQIEGGRI